VLKFEAGILDEIWRHGEAAYPEEGAGLLLGTVLDGVKVVSAIYPLDNAREDSARHNRYLLEARDYARAEDEAAARGLDVLGVFHSHPDHPARPSEFDREWAFPWFSYVITSISNGKAGESRAWLLAEDRQRFEEEVIVEITPKEKK
jgi:proteasome lid subunit RPN8/RPN11